jgi:hypothetical protein
MIINEELFSQRLKAILDFLKYLSLLKVVDRNSSQHCKLSLINIILYAHDSGFRI